MRRHRLALAVALLALGAGAAPAAQSGTIVIATPLPEDRADSAYALALVRELRRQVRITGMAIARTDDICELLRASRISCGQLMSHAEAAQLASAMGAAAFVVVRLRRASGPVMHLSLYDRRRTGLSGAVEVRGELGAQPRDLARLAAAALSDQWLAARSAGWCYDYRDRGLFAYARSAAEGAFAVNPHHPSAALCVATIFEQTSAPPDSLLWAYGRAVAGDSLQYRAADRVTALHLQMGDTLAALPLLVAKIGREPENEALWRLVLASWIAVGHPDSALALLGGRAARDVGEPDPELLRFMAQACAQVERWDCHVAALGRLYTLDSALVGDTAYYKQIIGAAQEAGDVEAVLAWTAEALRQGGLAVREAEGGVAQARVEVARAEERVREARRSQRALALARAAALAASGARDSALAAYRALQAAHPADPRPLLAAAQVLLDPRFLVVDSAAPLDTAALRAADSLLAAAVAAAPESDVRQTAAALYFEAGSRLARAQMAPAVAASWLERAIAHDADGRLREPAHALLGLALFFVVQRLDAEIRERQTCELVEREEAVLARALEATTIGESAYPAVAHRVREGLRAYGEFVPQFRAALGCGNGGGVSPGAASDPTGGRMRAQRLGDRSRSPTPGARV